MKKRIWIAEDDAVIRYALRVALEKHPSVDALSFRDFPDGLPLLEEIKKCDPRYVPHVVVTDYEMPGINVALS